MPKNIFFSLMVFLDLTLYSLWWPFLTLTLYFLDLTLTVLSMTLMLTGYLQYPFEIILAEFRAKAIIITGPLLHHTETSKFDL